MVDSQMGHHAPAIIAPADRFCFDLLGPKHTGYKALAHLALWYDPDAGVDDFEGDGGLGLTGPHQLACVRYL